MSQVQAQSEHAESLGLDLSKDSDVAVYMMMYQIGLKERGQNLLGNHSCINLSRDEAGNTTLSFGMNTDAFATGTVDFNGDNNSKYAHTKKTLAELFGFFEEAQYQPQIGVRSYADPQQNIMNKYASGGAIANRYNAQLFSEASQSDPRFDTDSKRRNYLLAYDRGQEFINNFFPENLKGRVSTTPYNSPDLEVGNNQSNSDKFACPNRRSIVVDMKFNPNFKVQSTPGAFTPAFQVARQATNHENILAAAFDASTKSLADLPAYCQNDSTKAFLERSKHEMKEVRKTFSKTDNLALMQEMFEQELSPERNERRCGRLEPIVKEKCFSVRTQLTNAFATYKTAPSDDNMYKLVAALTYTADNRKKVFVRNICRSSDSKCSKYQKIVDGLIPISDRMSANNKSLNSSHFMDCFSNKLFYQKEFETNAAEYLTPVVDLRDPQTGELRVNLTADNIPTTGRGKGFLCQACGNGLKFEDGHFDYSHRARTSHPAGQLADSQAQYNNIMAGASSNNMFLMGQQKGLNVYIIKDCNTSDMANVMANSQMVALQDLSEKKVTVAPGDCIFKPHVINSCVHAPAGEGDGEEDQMTYVSTVPSLLTGKNLEITLESNVDIINELMTGLQDDYIKTCHFEDRQNLKDTPKDIIDGILCENRGIHIPKPSFNSAQDCPDVAQNIQR
tara:strand:+ start:9054 stop:11078 length:2025 start_codon:yes stop_codon:yes gene_type:complete